MAPPSLRINFVCTGNICRSPTAHYMLLRKLHDAGLAHRVDVLSCGTSAEEVGSPADARTVAVARARGYPEIARHVAAQLAPAHFETCTLLLALDAGHLAHLRRRGGAAAQPRVRLLCEYARSARFRGEPVPDPWYGSDSDFELVADMLEDATDGLLAAISAALAQADPAAALLQPVR